MALDREHEGYFVLTLAFCNNAKQHCIEHGSQCVAMLDTDFRDSNDTQDILLDRNSILFLSIHGEPSMPYPYFPQQFKNLSLKLPSASKNGR